MKTIYITDDGKKFEDLELAQSHDEELAEAKKEAEEKARLKMARKCEVDAAYEKFLELEEAYIKDYERWTFEKKNADDDEPEFATNDWFRWFFS